MTQEESILAMKAGHKVRHKNYRKGEFIHIVNGSIVDQDDSIVTWIKYRPNSDYFHGYDIITENGIN